LAPEFLFVIAAAFAAGLIDAMAGGGGLIVTPALFAAFPQSPHTDLLGTSKVASLSGSLSAVARYARHVELDWPLLSRAAAAAFAAGAAGAWLATLVSPLEFRALVPVMLALVLVYTLTHRDFGRRAGSGRRPPRTALTLAGAAAIGGYDGFFGPGTGSFLIFLFVGTCGYDFLHASASAKIVNSAANLAAILLFGLTSDIRWQLGLAMAVATMLGAQIGSHLAIRRGTAFVRSVFLLVVGSLIAKTAHDAWLAAPWLAAR
jgi:uncharacterized membrane protein YfcA